MMTRSRFRSSLMNASSQDGVMINSEQQSPQGPRFSFALASDGGTVTGEPTARSRTPSFVNVDPHESTPDQAHPGDSELKFASIHTVNDSGVKLHAEWEREQRERGSAPRDPQPSVVPNSSSAAGQESKNKRKRRQQRRKRRKMRNRESFTPVLESAIINVKAIGDDLCQASKSSAFSGDNYLPLDALVRILSPPVVRELLFQHIKANSNQISELQTEVLGCKIKQTLGRRRIFAILVLINEVARLTDFVDRRLDDRDLPFSFVSKPGMNTQKELSCSRLTRIDPPSLWGPKSTQDFLIYQKVVHVPFFRFPGPELYFYELDPGSILPFHSDEVVVNGGYGSVRKVGIHDAHHDYCENGKKVDSLSFAVKRLHAADQQEFIDEVKVFEKLRTNNNKEGMPSHLIPLQLSYKRGIDFYLVFPWADGNLKEFWFHNTRDPGNPQHVCWFLMQCLGIARGLGRIHHLSTLSIEQTNKKNQATLAAVATASASLSPEAAKHFVLSPTVDRQEWGRHGDIKPENILWFREYTQTEGGGSGGGGGDCDAGSNKGTPALRDHMVISDFGLTCFNSAHSRSRVVQDQIRGFSGTYRPPELHLARPITQRYDVWSLGCVLLEFTSWFLLDYDEGIGVFSVERVKDGLEIDQQREDKFFGMRKLAGEDDKMEAVLKDSVKKWIEKLHGNCSELIHALLDLIQFAMLVPDDQNRMDCRMIRKELRDLNEKCNKSQVYATEAFPGKPRPFKFDAHGGRRPGLHKSYSSVSQ